SALTLRHPLSVVHVLFCIQFDIRFYGVDQEEFASLVDPQIRDALQAAELELGSAAQDLERNFVAKRRSFLRP
ncbi:MAG: hypothetical protein AAF725_17175, partial [Acidobacteriota bacterium]